MIVQSFNGGVNSRLRPQFLQANQGAVYNNIDSRVGSLTGVKESKQTSISLKQFHHWYDAKRMWVDSDIRRDYVEYNRVLYYTDRVSQPKKFDGSNTYSLGIALPQKIGSLTVKPRLKAPKDFTLSRANTSSGLPRQTQFYLLLTKNSNGYSDACYVSITESGRVSTLATELRDLPTPSKVTAETTGKMHVTIRNVKDVDFDKCYVDVYRIHSGDWRFVGALTSSTATIIDTVEDISGAAKLTKEELAPLKGTYSYVQTWYNINDGSESGPSVVSEEVELEDGGTVLLSSLGTTTDPQVTHRRLYRVGGNLGVFSLVTELSKNSTSFEDNIFDSKIKGGRLPSVSAAPAPVGLSYLTESSAMLFGALNNKLRFTPIGVPDSWPEPYFLQYDADITGIAAVATGLLVFTKYKTHLVTGSGPASLSTYQLSGDQGCLAFESVQQIGTAAVWVSTDGVCASSGNQPEIVTLDALGRLAIDAVDSEVYNNVYYVLDSSGTMYAVGNDIVQTYTLGNKSVVRAENNLYGWYEGRLRVLFEGAARTEFNYLSPRYTDGMFTRNKTYKKVFLFSSGRVKIKILINDVVVQEKLLETTDNHTIQIPSDLQRGFYIQFDIVGTGEVSEISWESSSGQ